MVDGPKVDGPFELIIRMLNSRVSKERSECRRCTTAFMLRVTPKGLGAVDFDG